jgi:glycerate 2-kinase
MSDADKLVRDARQVLASVQAAADPALALARQWGLVAAAIQRGNDDGADREPGTRVHVLAIGKASAAMAAEALTRVRGMGRLKLMGGIATCPPECVPAGDAQASTGEMAASVRFLAADHPRSTARNAANAREIEAFVRSVGPEDVLLALVSGGASAHLASPAAGLSVEDLDDVYAALRRAGADIGALNAVRKHCEMLKGGRLAALCAGRVVAAVLSDVVGDRLDVIASGPTAADPTTFAEALAVLDRFGIEGEHAAMVRAMMRRGVAGEIAETPKPGDPVFTRVTNIIVGSSRGVLRAAAETAAKLKYHVVSRADVMGDASEAAREFAEQALRLRRARCGAIALVWAGETTVRVDSSRLQAGESIGRGGPSQEFALAAAAELSRAACAGGAVECAGGDLGPDIGSFALLAYSTDGVDGESDNAGVLVTHETWSKARDLGLDAERALVRHDAAGFFEACGAHVRTGPTGTNVNHVAAILMPARKM